MKLNEVQLTCEFVMKNSEHVKINYEELDKFIKNIDCKKINNWLISNPYSLFDLKVEKIINLLLLLECICYSFWG